MQIEIPGIEGSGELWLEIIRLICKIEMKDNWWLCDLCCHKAPYTSQLGASFTTYVDIQYRGLEVRPYSNFEFVCKDVFDWFKSNDNTYDVMICSDGVEHFSKSDGSHLIELMCYVSRKAIIFTPFGEQSITNDETPDSHKSGWTPLDFSQLEEGQWAFIVFPDFHKSLNCGAFFAWHSDNLKEEFESICNKIKKQHVQARIS